MERIMLMDFDVRKTNKPFEKLWAVMGEAFCTYQKHEYFIRIYDLMVYQISIFKRIEIGSFAYLFVAKFYCSYYFL